MTHPVEINDDVLYRWYMEVTKYDLDDSTTIFPDGLLNHNPGLMIRILYSDFEGDETFTVTMPANELVWHKYDDMNVISTQLLFEDESNAILFKLSLE